MLEAPRSLSVHDVRPVNRARLLWHLLQGPMTRRDLAESLDLSNSAVTNVLAGLVAEGLVDESFPAAADERRVGRPSAVVTLVPNSRLVIGLQIGKGSVSGVLCDLRGGILSRESREFDATPNPHTTLEATAAIARTLRQAAGSTPILGAGVAAPGRVDDEGRTLLTSLNLGWTDIPIADTIQDVLGVPAVLERNLGAMAFGEHLLGRWRDIDTLVFVHTGSGVGAGIMIEGRPFRGFGHGVSGFGHLPIPGATELCVCGAVGCLETVASIDAVERTIRAAARRRELPDAAQLLQSDAPLSALLTLVRSGRSDAAAVLDHALDGLASALVSVVNLFEPTVIVTGGYLESGHDVLIPRLRSRLMSRVFPLARDTIRLEPATFGADSGVVGAAAVAMDRLLYSPQWRAASARRQGGARVGG